MKSVSEVVANLFTGSKLEPDSSGNPIRRAFLPFDRLRVDFADDFAAQHWEQYHTTHDASYFGVWVNRHTLQTLTYTERDWTLVLCPDWEHFAAEITDANKFYGEGYIAKVFDDRGVKTTLVQDRSKFLEKPS